MPRGTPLLVPVTMLSSHETARRQAAQLRAEAAQIRADARSVMKHARGIEREAEELEYIADTMREVALRGVLRELRVLS